jgi:tape measure domain-containing protein
MPVGANAGLAGLNVNVGVNLQQFNAGMAEIEKRGAQVTQNLNSMGSALTTGAGIGAGVALATAALSGLAEVAGAASSAVIGLNSDLEQARIGFTAFTGSAEKANAFVKQLQDFAAKTTFEFPGLLQSARQLTGMGVQAELVIPILKDVGTAVMSVGGGDVQIKRVNKALTDMMAAGKVSAQDMMQLANAGLPGWKMLADSMGMTIGQVKELSKQGKISSDQMLQAFHDFANRSGLDTMLEKSSQTWQAATSNIIDGLRNIGAEGFEPLFNVMRDFAVQVANLLTGDSAKQFAADLKATVQDIITTMSPLGDILTHAFDAFKTGGVSAALNSVLTDVQKLATEMGGAGVQLITEFAGGIMQGASSLITEAANFVADIIASYLIGSSPPPVGPLSNIVEGGTNVIAAYVDGLKAGTAGVSDVAQSIVDAFGNVEGAMTLTQGRAALQAAGTDMKALESAVQSAEGVLRSLDQQIQDNQASLRDYQNAATDIKDAFEGAIDPLQRQVDALKEVNDLTQKQEDIQSRIQMAQLKGALQTAQGNPVERAKLQTQIDTLEQQDKELSLQERALTLQNQSAALAAKARGEKVTDTQGSAAVNALAQRRLGIQQQQNQLQQQINGMVDKEAVARIKTEQAQVTAVKDQRDINSEIASLQRQLQAAPLEQHIKDLKAQEQALLTPINERIKAAQREGQELQDQRKHWQDIKAAITDVMQEQRRLAAEAKKDATEAAKNAKEAALSKPSNLASIFNPQEIVTGAEKVGQSWLAGFNGYLAAHAAGLIGGTLGAVLGGAAFGPLGAVAGAMFGKSFMERMQQNFGSMENFGGLLAGKISDALNIDTGAANNAVEAFAIIFETMRDRALAALEQLRAGIAGKLQDAQGVLSTWQGQWQQTFGADSSGAQAGIAAIDGVNKALQALQLLMSGDLQGALNTFKESFAQLGNAGTDASAQLTKSLTDIQTAIQPAVDEIKSQWQSIVDTINSAQFQDNISIIGKNISLVLQAIAGDLDKTKLSLDTWNNTKVDGTKFVDLGAALQSVVHDVAVLSTAFINLMDLLSTLDKASQLFVQNIGSALRGAADIIKATMAFARGDFDAAEAIFGDKLQMDRDIAARGADIQKMWSDMLARIKARAGEVNAAGKSIPEGIAAGITEGAPTVEEASANLATQSVTSKFAETMQSRSPSVVMTEQGMFITDGLAAGITAGTPVVVAAVTDECTQMLAAYTEGWSAISEGTSAQLDEIYALMQGKFTDMVGLVPIMMQEMQTAVATGLSAIHTQMTGQLDEIHTLIMMQSESWRAAGLALGTALGEGIASAQLNVQRNMMQLMSTGGGAGGAVTGGSKADPQMQALLNQMANKYKLDAKLFTAQMQLESAGFDPRVTSGARRGGSGEVGIGQMMPATLTAALQKNGLTLDQYLGDAKVQVELAAQHMAELVAVFGDYDKALQAYNGGSGGVGSAATQKYASLVHEIATTLQSQNAGGAGTQLMSASAGRMNLNVDQITAGRQAGLSMAEAQAICGPYAAVLFAQATGKNPSLAEAKELASAVGWTAGAGMGGTGNFMSLLGRMGINAVRQAATPENVNAALAAGNPIALSTPRHYFVGSGGTAAGGINVGATGTVMGRYGGTANMTLDQINSVGGGISDLIVLQGKLEAAGTKTFSTLTTVTGQYGDVLNEGVSTADAAITASAQDSDAATQQLTATTQTLAASIAGGVVPAGLAARDAVGQMAIGIQPLIAAWANGQVNGDQLAQSMVQLASDTGLATQPLAALQAGNVSVGEALRTVMTALAQADPAFADIQTSMQGTQLSTEQLANVLQQGLANVTGNVSAALAQAAQGVVPLQTAFATGAISGEQFAQSVVQLAATSGLTQQPLRDMQDGVLTTAQALGQVVSQVAETNPGLAELAKNIESGNVPLADGAKMFLDWTKAQADAQTATTDTSQVIADLPAALTDIQAPMQDASTTAMQTLPDATTEALTATVDAIRGITGDATSAATEVGQAIVDAIKSTVEGAAEDIARAAKDIVEKALEAAKKAAEEVKKSAGKSDNKGDGGDSADSRARGGHLSAGRWTVVGEEGPELISPSGYVYTAQESATMMLQGINSGLFTLHKMASGGSTKSKSKKKKKGGDEGNSGAPWLSGGTQIQPTTKPKYEAAKTKEEYDLEEKILSITKARDTILADIAPIDAAITLETLAQKRALEGSYLDQLNIINNKKAQLDIDLQILKLTYEADASGKSLNDQQNEMNALKRQQDALSKGDIKTQLVRNDLEVQQLTNNQRIAQLQVAALPARQALANLEKQIADIQKGSIADQLLVQEYTAQQHVNQQRILQLQIQQAPLQAEAAATQADINKILAGTVEQRAQIAANTKQSKILDLQSLAVQKQLLPIQTAIRETQQTIDDIQKGSLEDQYASIDAQKEAAQLRLQEININNQLRNVNAGTLKLSQEEINALQVQLESVQAQKANLDDQTEIKQLNATIASTDAQKTLAALQKQEATHQQTQATLDDQHAILENQNSTITTQNEISAAGQQAKLDELNVQMAAYNDQVTTLQAQNAVLDLQVQNIQLGNTIRADALGAQLISLQSQVSEYDTMVLLVQQENDKIAVQTGLIDANNQLAAAGLNAQIIMLQTSITRRQTEIDKLNEMKGSIQGQTDLINTQNQVAAAGHDANLLSLNTQKNVQDDITVALNTQLGTLNAQKRVYEDIRDLANQINNRPPDNSSSPTGGPPGAVAATASKSGEPTLYLSRGTGTDGWYTADGRLIVQGGSASPPSGYRVQWLAEGGTWHRGQVAVVGEDGPELAIAAQDMHVFPHERSASIARAFGKARSVIGVDDEASSSGRNVTVNVEYHRHSGTDYGEAGLPTVVREAINVALRS